MSRPRRVRITRRVRLLGDALEAGADESAARRIRRGHQTIFMVPGTGPLRSSETARAASKHWSKPALVSSMKREKESKATDLTSLDIAPRFRKCPSPTLGTPLADSEPGSTGLPIALTGKPRATNRSGRRNLSSTKSMTRRQSSRSRRTPVRCELPGTGRPGVAGISCVRQPVRVDTHCAVQAAA